MTPSRMVRRRSGLYVPRSPTNYHASVMGRTASLKRYWKMNDASGTTNPTDSSSSGVAGEVVGTVTFGVSGLITGSADTAAQFSTSPAGRVKKAYSSFLNTSEWSVECVIYPTSLPGGNSTIVGVDDNGSALKWRVYTVGSAISLVWKVGGSYFTLTSASGALVINTKYHIGVTYKEGGSAFIYKNGVQVATTASNTGVLSTSTVPEFLVGALSGLQEPFTGKIQAVSYDNVQLSAAVIAADAAFV